MQAHNNILQKRAAALRSAPAPQLAGKNAQPITDNRKHNPLQLVKNTMSPVAVQQKQGRVKPAKQLKSKININDDKGLETEADIMGAKAITQRHTAAPVKQVNHTAPAIQRKITVSKDEYGSQEDNMEDLKLLLNNDLDFSESVLKQHNVSVDQVLTRFDFQNRKFKNIKALVEAIRNELKTDLGPVEAPKVAVDKLVSIHPLENDDSAVISPVLELLRKKDPDGNVRNLILEDTEAAKLVMNEYRKKTLHPESDTILFKSILATIELHQSGALYRQRYSEEENEILSYATGAYGKQVVKEMIEDYGLDEYEHKSIKAYSLPDKDKIFVHGVWNKYYMGYSKGNWDKYGDGWKAMASAMKKLPSLGKLRLNVTTYRASRNNEESNNLEKLQTGSPIVHGKHILGQQQQHYTSTALTYNVHNEPGRVKKAKGLMAIHASSGVLINPFGKQGFLDGAEILFPPHMVTTLKAKKNNAFSTPRFSAPVYHLVETTSPVERSEVVDDFKFKKLKAQYLEQQERTSEEVTALINQIQQFSNVIYGGKNLNLANTPQTVEYLESLKQKLFDVIEANMESPEIINNYKKLVLINKLRTIPVREKINRYLTKKGKDDPGRGFWEEDLKTLENLVQFYGL